MTSLAPAAGQRREAAPAARAESEPERACRAVCLVRQVLVLGPHRATRRGASPGLCRKRRGGVLKFYYRDAA